MLAQLQLLAGQSSTLSEAFDNLRLSGLKNRSIGVSQLNELLLAAGFDRVSEGFFAFLVKGQPIDYKDGTTIKGMDDLHKCVDTVRKYAALKYGNFKFAFKKWCRMTTSELRSDLEELLPRRDSYFRERTPPMDDIQHIAVVDRYHLGYITGFDHDGRRKQIQEIAEANLRRYLVFDHMDVYVATSMRKPRDFLNLGRFVDKVFTSEELTQLKIRYFDPTQAHSDDRFCKGLVESLMLKRAKCAVYCVQECDTFGKDSELAVMLAQGKPVLAYVPSINNVHEYAAELRTDFSKDDDPVTAMKLCLAESFPELAVQAHQIYQCSNPEEVSLELSQRLRALYEKRARVLGEVHPLSLQVNLSTGVAHGLILVRTPEECSRILRELLLRTADYYLEEKDPVDTQFAKGDYTRTYVLREKITNSAVRVVVGDELLTNSFWNFYLREAD